MKYLMNKLKLVGTGFLALSFFMAVTLSSCGTTGNQSDDDDSAEATEQAEGTDEHPAGEEEHPAGENEHPSDSTATEGEHPEG